MAWYQGPPTPAERPSCIPSRRPQINIQDGIAMPGFDIEFKHSLKRAWEDHEDNERSRLAKYFRFGMKGGSKTSDARTYARGAQRDLSQISCQTSILHHHHHQFRQRLDRSSSITQTSRRILQNGHYGKTLKRITPVLRNSNNWIKSLRCHQSSDLTHQLGS